MARSKPPSFAGKLWQAAQDAYGEGREEWTRSFREGRKKAGKSEDAPRWNEMTGAYPTGIRLQELADDIRYGKNLPKEKRDQRLIRESLGIGPKTDRAERIGQILGTVGADLTQDNTRNFWWLLNAAQAAGNVITEGALAAANPKLYGKHQIINQNTQQPYSVKKDVPPEYKSGGTYRKGISVGDDGTLYQRNYEPGHKAALLIPTGVAINTGLGLLTPFGGAEGYKAAIPNEEDPSVTDNVLGEIALKYMMGRTGQLLPYSEFVKVRPDVSPEEYAAYQAFKYDKSEDLNPLDGDFSVGAGALRGTTEGIHGPEIQFLGRSLPVTTGLVPFGSALAGTVIGVRGQKPIRGGMVGGLTGLATGQITGQILEAERRRRNAEENGIIL